MTLLDPTKYIESICLIISNLSIDHVALPNVLPCTHSYGGNRKDGVSWLERYPWPLYSPKLDAVFCGPCSLLLPSVQRRDKGLLVNRPFSNWVKIATH